MESMKEKLTEYAQLLVRVGLNMQRPIRPVAGRW